MGDVNNVYDASRHTTNHSTSSSHSHHEDKSQHYDQSVTKQVTVHNAGMSPVVMFAMVGVVVAGFVLMALALRPPLRDSSPHADLSGSQNFVSATLAKDAKEIMEPVTPLKMSPMTEPVPTLDVRLNQSSYKVGDLLQINVTSLQAGHLYVLAVWADGRVDTLFPNSLHPEAKIAAGTSLRLPDDFPPNETQGILTYPLSMPQLPGNPASATESILAVLSPVPLDLPKSTELKSIPFFAAVGVMDDPEFRTRGPQPKFLKMQKSSMFDFGALPQAAVHYEIRR